MKRCTGCGLPHESKETVCAPCRVIVDPAFMCDDTPPHRECRTIATFLKDYLNDKE